MKKSSKIKILTPSEMKQQVASQDAMGHMPQEHSGDCGSGNMLISGSCYNSGIISCCGVVADAHRTVVKGKLELEYLVCTKEDGTTETSNKCDLTLAGSGVATTMFGACENKKARDRCEWFDTTLHQGKCEIEGGGNDPYGALFCDETQFP